MTSINEEVTWDGPKYGPLPIHKIDEVFRVPCAYLCTVTSECGEYTLDMYVTTPKKGEKWSPRIFLHWGAGRMGLCHFRNNRGEIGRASCRERV